VFASVLQYLYNGIVTGGILALPTIGFSLIYKILRFPNFAFGAYLTCGAYAAFAFNVILGQSIIVALSAAMIITAGIGALVDQIAFRNLRQRRPLALAIVSIGAYFILENIVRFIWGGELRHFRLAVYRDVQFFGIHIGKEQVMILIAAAFFMLVVQVMLKGTRLGKAMRALADNPSLARIKGIQTERIILLTSAVGGALAGSSGVFLGIDTLVEPLMGFNVILAVFAAAILGGIGNAKGAMAGALVIGTAEELSLLFIPSTYKSAVGLGVIILILILRPSGLFKS
jgi:branched-chain amino acid transport system permease protein/neutral amino acid transport system permease protein